MTTPATQVTQSAEILPNPTTLLQAAKIAMEQDRAIMLDYFRQTANGTAFLGEDPETKDKILVKSKDEFTSMIKKLYKAGDDFIILTENSNEKLDETVLTGFELFSLDYAVKWPLSLVINEAVSSILGIIKTC